MFYAFAGSDQAEIAGLFLNLFIAFGHDALHSLAKFAFGLLAGDFKGLLDAVELLFRLTQVRLEGFLQFR